MSQLVVGGIASVVKPYRVEVFRRNRKWHVRVRHPNGRVFLSSTRQGYERRGTAIRIAKRFASMQVINALVPWSDDLLFFGCDSMILRLDGDPMAGGRTPCSCTSR